MHAGSQFRRIEDMVDALLILSAFKAVKPSPEKMEAGLSPFFIKYSFTSKESIQMPY